MKIFIGADHNGFDMKALLIEALTRDGYEVIDEGNDVQDPADDFPQFAARVAKSVQGSDDSDVRGILICGSGQGMCMAANRFPGIRAGLVWDVKGAHASRNDSDSNVLCLPAHQLAADKAVELTKVWLHTPFDGAERFTRRIKELDTLT
jgi:ribose 5-phosphate isomerase B